MPADPPHATDDDPRYPIGAFTPPTDTGTAARAAWADAIARVPHALEAALAGLDAAQLDTPYRDGGWTVREVVHHLGDSHANALVRLKTALTAPGDPVTAYDETAWVRTPEVQALPIGAHVALVAALQPRLAALVGAMTDADVAKTVRHPENGVMTMGTIAALYAWHGAHHVAQVAQLRARRGW